MPFMLGYHPAFKLHSTNPTIIADQQKISLDEVLEVGNRALLVENCTSITLQDEKDITIETEGFGHFMCWTEVRNMVCIEPISFYPYAVNQRDLYLGFQHLKDENAIFKVKLTV
jgi:galactose mutarotase-like enzyme